MPETGMRRLPTSSTLPTAKGAPFMRLTVHAEMRSQQRAIPPALIELIRAYGSPTPARLGCTRYLLDRHSIALACEGDRRLSARLERHRGTWLVAGPDDQVVTVGHQTLRFFN